MNDNNVIKAIIDKYFGGHSSPLVIISMLIISFIVSFFVFFSEQELFPHILSAIHEVFDDETASIVDSDPEPTETSFFIETTSPRTTVITTQPKTNSVTKQDSSFYKNITKIFVEDGQTTYSFKPRISGDHWFGLDISTVKSRYKIEIYNQKDESLKSVYSYENGMSVHLNEGEEYLLIISTDTDNYPFEAFIEIEEPNVTQVIEVN